MTEHPKDKCVKLLEDNGFKIKRIRKVGNFGCLFDLMKLP